MLSVFKQKRLETQQNIGGNMIIMFNTTNKLRQQKISLIVRSIAENILTVVMLCGTENFFKLYGPARKRGFFCDDESLKYPYREDTVTPNTLMALTLYVPPIIVVIGELVLLFKRKKQRFSSYKDRGILTLILRLHHNIVPYYCCFAMQALFVHLTKVSVGSLRPHFFQVCQPYRLTDGSTCNESENQGIFIEDYECQTLTEPALTADMLYGVHISFPSGHASYIFYSMVYIVFYLQRFSKELLEYYRINVGLLMLLLQMSCVLLAWFVAVSRLMDYKHHWSDVLVGMMLGSSVAIAVSLYVLQQLNSVNILPQGVKSANLVPSITSYATTMPNTILVP